MLSREDRKFLKKMKEDIHQERDGHYRMPLALHRLGKLRTRLKNDHKYRQDYIAFMNNVIKKGYAEKVPDDERLDDDGRMWYIPHHGVY